MVMEGDLTCDGEHTVECTDDVLWNCAPETCIISLTVVTSINSIKKKEKEHHVLLSMLILFFFPPRIKTMSWVFFHLVS